MKNRHRASYRRYRGRRDFYSKMMRRALRWYLGWHERYWIEGELGYQPHRGAVRDTFLEVK